MLRTTASSESWEFPWAKRFRKNRPLLVPESQTGRNVGELCFLLCFLSVLMLSSSLILIGLSIWSLIIKADYHYLLDIKVDIPYFSLPAGFLLLPGFWIATAIHNNRKRRQFIYLLILVTVVSSSLLITGSILGLLYSIKTDQGTLKLSSSLENYDLNKSISFSFLRYNTSDSDKAAWNKIQQRLECCGISNYNDWQVIGLDIPTSCCNEIACNANTSFGRSCLDSISRDLLWHQNILKSHCYIMVVIQVSTREMARVVQKTVENYSHNPVAKKKIDFYTNNIFNDEVGKAVISMGVVISNRLIK